MKWQILLALFLSSQQTIAFGQTPDETKKPEKYGPQFLFDAGETHDYGAVKRGPALTDTFWFHNSGNAPLIVYRVRPGCGCTSVGWSEQPVAPGQKGYVAFELDTRQQHGSFSKQLYIDSNVPPDSRKGYLLRIKGKAKNRVRK